MAGAAAFWAFVLDAVRLTVEVDFSFLLEALVVVVWSLLLFFTFVLGESELIFFDIKVIWRLSWLSSALSFLVLALTLSFTIDSNSSASTLSSTFKRSLVASVASSRVLEVTSFLSDALMRMASARSKYTL